MPQNDCRASRCQKKKKKKPSGSIDVNNLLIRKKCYDRIHNIDQQIEFQRLRSCASSQPTKDPAGRK